MCDTEYWKAYPLEVYNRKNRTAHKEVTMVDECGTLIMKRDGNTFKRGPGLLEKAANLAGTVKEVVSQAIDGGPILAPENIVEYRLGLCKVCPYYDKKLFCRACGCITEAKARLAAAKCPEGKWQSV